MKIIGFNKKNFNQSIFKNVEEVLKSGWLTHGKYTSLFEREFSKYVNSKYAITVSSCTAALHLSCLASGFSKGDEVIVPSMTHVATAHAVEYTGAKPIFADINLYDGNINFEEIKKKANNKTKGIIVVHMAGLVCDMKKIKSFCKKRNIKIIEDCAHAVGSKFENISAGNFGISGCFSFYPTKQITTGEGGMLVTNNYSFYKKIKQLKAFGIDKDIDKRKKQGTYNVLSLGYNYRMTDFQAAMGYSQILNYKKNLEHRKKIAGLYYKILSKNIKIMLPKLDPGSSYFIFQIFIKKKIRDKVLNFFKNNKIGVSIHYAKPIPGMFYYKKKYKLSLSNYKNSKIYSDTNISLPISENISKEQVKYICKKLLEAIKTYDK